MKFNFDEFIPRVGTDSLKWEYMHNVCPGISSDALPLWVADMDFSCAPKILKALHDEADNRIFGYSAFDTVEYLRAVCGWLYRKFDWYVDSKTIVYATGVVPALWQVVDYFTSDGDGVLMFTPAYYHFPEAIEAYGRTVVESPLIDDDGYYRIDFEDMAEKCAHPDVTMLLFCSPQNPGGRVWTEEELRKVEEICRKNNVLIVSDEIHMDLLRKGQKHIPLAKLFPDNMNIITCCAASKTFNMAGLRLSNIIIPDEAKRNHWKDRAGAVVNSTFAMAAAMAAYNWSGDWKDALCDYIDDNLSFVDSYLKTHLPKAKFRIPEGSYLAWVDVRGYCENTKALVDKLALEGKVLIEAGEGFGEVARGYVRINVACPRKLLREALDRMEKVLNRIHVGSIAHPFTFKNVNGETNAFPQQGKPCTLVFLRDASLSQTQYFSEKVAQVATETNASIYVVVHGDLPKRSNGKTVEYVHCETLELYDLYKVACAYSKESIYSVEDVSMMEEIGESFSLDCSKEGILRYPAIFSFDENGVCKYAAYGKSALDFPDVKAAITACLGEV